MIYFLRPKAGGLIKIGTTIRLSARLNQIASECGEDLEVLAVCSGSFDTERELHQRFAHLRKHGEWFEPGSDLLGFIVQDATPWDGKDEVPRTGQNLNVWLPDDIMDAFEQMLARTRRTKTAEVLVMMEAYLKDAGLWPPKSGK